MYEDDRAETDLRRWLAGVPVPPTGLAVAGVLQLARRRTRQRRLLAASGTAAAVLVTLATVPSAAQLWPDPATPPGPLAATGTPSAPPPPEPIRCRATVLEPPDGLAERGVVDPRGIPVTGMDPTGRYVVGETDGSENNSPVSVLWDAGAPVVIPTTGHHATPVDVNSRGEVVGDGTRTRTGPFYSWIYRDGVVTELALPDGYRESYVAGINETGDVVGGVQDADYRSVVVVWPAGSPGSPRILPAPDGTEVAPAAITDDGTVVGSFHGSLVSDVGGYLWEPDGTGRKLPRLAGMSGDAIEDARGDWAVGYAIPAGRTKSVPVRWDLRTGTAAELPGFQARPSLGAGGDAVNPAGDVVVGEPLPQVLRADGREVELAVPVPGAVPDPVAISDDGTRVAGTLIYELPPVATAPADPGDLPRPVVWDC